MPSSSLVKVEVEVGFGVEVKVRAQNYFFGVGWWLGGWVVEWVAGEMENKVIFQLEIEVEVEVEVGAWQLCHVSSLIIGDTRYIYLWIILSALCIEP